MAPICDACYSLSFAGGGAFDGAGDGEPPEVHERMRRLVGEGVFPATTYQQLARARKVTSVIGVPPMLQEARDFGYIGPNLRPPTGGQWVYGGGAWRLRQRGGWVCRFLEAKAARRLYFLQKNHLGVARKELENRVLAADLPSPRHNFVNFAGQGRLQQEIVRREGRAREPAGGGPGGPGAGAGGSGRPGAPGEPARPPGGPGGPRAPAPGAKFP